MYRFASFGCPAVGCRPRTVACLASLHSLCSSVHHLFGHQSAVMRSPADSAHDAVDGLLLEHRKQHLVPHIADRDTAARSASVYVYNAHTLEVFALQFHPCLRWDWNPFSLSARGIFRCDVLCPRDLRQPGPCEGSGRQDAQHR